MKTTFPTLPAATFVTTVPWEWIEDMRIWDVLQEGAPDRMGAERLRAMRGNTRYSLQLPDEALNDGAPCEPLRCFLRLWLAMWPFHGWFLAAEDPLLGLLALACAEQSEVVYHPASQTTMWHIAADDRNRFSQLQAAGIVAIGDLIQAEEHETKAQLSAVELSLRAFIRPL